MPKRSDVPSAWFDLIVPTIGCRKFNFSSPVGANPGHVATALFPGWRRSLHKAFVAHIRQCFSICLVTNEALSKRREIKLVVVPIGVFVEVSAKFFGVGNRQ